MNTKINWTLQIVYKLRILSMMSLFYSSLFIEIYLSVFHDIRDKNNNYIHIVTEYSTLYNDIQKKEKWKQYIPNEKLN